MVRRSRAYLTVAIVCAAAAAAAIPLSPAIGQESPPTSLMNVELGDEATLGARGAVIFVTVFYKCAPGAADAFVSVQVTQRSGNGIARGFGGDEVTCTGGDQAVTLDVSPFERPFRGGVAFATATGEVCSLQPQFECASDRDAEEIRIVRSRP